MEKVFRILRGISAVVAVLVGIDMIVFLINGVMNGLMEDMFLVMLILGIGLLIVMISIISFILFTLILKKNPNGEGVKRGEKKRNVKMTKSRKKGEITR